MPEVLKAAELLKKHNLSATVASFHSIKPLDTEFLQAAAKQHKLLVTVEEHGLIGGLGSAVAEWSAHSSCTTPQLNFGTPDEFMHEIGSQEYARTKYGLVAENIASRVFNKLSGI
jgi:transketolase